jgi:glycine/D-amino acid oxidase-like deaminating enzyme
MMYLALTYDHRIIDGREAVQFLVTVKECLRRSGRHAARSLITSGEHDYDVIVIGGGPAGYPAAIRAAQNKPAGRLHRRMEEPRRFAACVRRHLPECGLHSLEGAARVLRTASPRAARVRGAWHQDRRSLVRCPQMQKRKAGIVKGMTGGILGLLKAAGVTALQGHGKLLAGRQVEFTAHDGKQQTLTAKHVVLASGSVPMELRSALSTASTSSIAGALWNFRPCRSVSASSAPV